jgi:hypothetical protein
MRGPTQGMRRSTPTPTRQTRPPTRPIRIDYTSAIPRTA